MISGRFHKQDTKSTIKENIDKFGFIKVSTSFHRKILSENEKVSQTVREDIYNTYI